MRLSIIVPIYNVEQYLERCIDSLYHQDIDFDDYEVIMVNDGSTDNSLDVATSIASKYRNASVVSQDNQGLSGARNTGISKAKGQFIMFIDSDDYIHNNCLHSLLDTAEKYDLDVCHFPIISVRPNRQFKGECNSLSYGRIYSGKEILADGSLIGSACSNLYKSDIFKEKNLRFTQGITHEDVEFSIRLYSNVNKVMKVDMDIYYYDYNPDSLSKSKSYEKVNKFVCDFATITYLGIKYASENVKDEELKQVIIKRENTSVIGMLYSLLRHPNRPKSIVKNLITEYEKYKVYPVKGPFLSWKSRLISYFLNNRKLFLWLYNYKRRNEED